MNLIRECKKILWNIFKVFIPTLLARIGFVFIGIVDSIVLGHYNTNHLAYQSLGELPVTIILLIINGLTMGVFYQTSFAVGQRKYQKAGKVWHFSLFNNFFLATPLLILCFFGFPFYTAIGQTPEVAHHASQQLSILAIGIPFGGIYWVSQFFLQGIKKPQIAMYMILIANVLNLICDIVLVFGLWGFPEMGALGTAYSTTFIRIFLALGLVAYILLMKESSKYGTHGFAFPNKSERKIQRRIGYGAVSNVLSEEVGNSANLIFAGMIGLSAVASYSITYRFMMLFYSVAIAGTVAGGYFLGKAFGEKNAEKIKITFLTSFWFCLILMIVLGGLVFISKNQLAILYTSDTFLQETLVSLFAIISISFFFNGGQASLLINLRTIRDIFIPSLIKGIVFIGIMPVLSFFLGIYLDLKVEGLILSILFSNTLAFLLFYWRAHFVLNKHRCVCIPTPVDY